MDRSTVSAKVTGPLNAQETPRLSADGPGWLMGPCRAMIFSLMISRILKTVMVEADVMSRGGTPRCPDVSAPGRLALKAQVRNMIRFPQIFVDFLKNVLKSHQVSSSAVWDVDMTNSCQLRGRERTEQQ